MAVRLIRERGYKDNTFFYHLGDAGHAYHFNTDTATSIYFKCVQFEKGCRGRAILRVGGGFRESKAHNHLPDPDFVGERHFRQNVLQQCQLAQYVSFQDVLDQARRDRRYSRQIRSRMTLRRLGTSMYNARMKSYPAIPHTLRELTQILLGHPRVSSTVDGMHNLYAASITAADHTHHVAFFSPLMLNFMGRLKLIQGDGTFRARPALPHSSQVFVLVTTWRDCVIPLGWVLMERRTRAAYTSVFELIKDLCPNFNPEVIISDWELAQQQAWQDAFPNAQIQGCLWHLLRAFIKKAMSLRLFRFHRDMPEILSFIRKSCAIPLLPRRFFRVALNVLRREAREANIVVAYLLIPFFTYIETNWINNDYRRNWMSFFNAPYRTNNSCETHNRVLRKAVGAYRPNIYLFIHALARLEHNATLDVELMTNGGSAKRSRRWTSVYNDRQLAALSRDLEDDVFHDRDQTISNFLGRASHVFHGAFDDHIAREVGDL